MEENVGKCCKNTEMNKKIIIIIKWKGKEKKSKKKKNRKEKKRKEKKRKEKKKEMKRNENKQTYKQTKETQKHRWLI